MSKIDGVNALTQVYNNMSSQKTLSNNLTGALQFPESTKKIQKTNSDGTVSQIEITENGSGFREKETKLEYLQDGVHIKSVKLKRAELYGGSDEKEYIDKDGDGFADTVVETDSFGKKTTTKLDKSKYSQDSLNMRRISYDGTTPDVHMAKHPQKLTNTMKLTNVPIPNTLTPAQKTEEFKNDLVQKLMNVSTAPRAKSKDSCQMYVNKLIETFQTYTGAIKNGVKCNGTPEQKEIFERRMKSNEKMILDYASFLGIEAKKDDSTGLYQLKIGNEIIDVPDRKVELKEEATEDLIELLPKIVD